MTVAFLFDEDIVAAVVEGLRTRAPLVDILDVKTAGLRGASDARLLELGAAQGRVVVSHDRNTMVEEFCRRLRSGHGSAGLVILEQGCNVGDMIETLLLICGASTAEEWRNRVLFLP